MKTLVFAIAFFCLVSASLAGHHGIHIGIPLPFIKIRFVDIAHLFGQHHGLGHHGLHHGGGFGLQLGGHGGGHHGF
ncbi:hypothetical protein X975_02514, partial [Stegodyphus mimosarum]